MSYDLQALELAPGADVEEALEALEERAPTDEERHGMQRVASALQAAAGSLRRSDQQDLIELSDDRLDITLYADEAAISIPYWFSGSEADDVLAMALACARVLRDVGGFAVWDQQLDRLVDAGTTAVQMREAYDAGR